MVAMQVAPTLPVGVAHSSEKRMRRELSVPLPFGKTFDQFFQLPPVAVETTGRRSANLLIHLRHRLDAVRPGQRRAKRNPLHHGSSKQILDRACAALSQRKFERIVQVANHLVRRHPAPSPLAIRLNVAQTLEDFFPVGWIQKALHSCFPQSAISIHFALLPLSTTASIIFIFATASSSGVGAGVSLMTASENRSP